MDIFMPPCHCNSADLRDDLCFLCLASCGGFTVLNSFIALSVPLPEALCAQADCTIGLCPRLDITTSFL